MFDQRQLARESLEIYLVHLILAYRSLIFIVGLLLLVYAIANMFTTPLAGYAILVPAIFLLLLRYSFNVVHTPYEDHGHCPDKYRERIPAALIPNIPGRLFLFYTGK